MSYYRTCPSCGANLDPGEQCTDCNTVRVSMPNGSVLACAVQNGDGSWVLYENLDADAEELCKAVADIKNQITKNNV